MAQDKERDAKCYIKQSRPAKWLVMIYLAGDNNLSTNCITILQEIEAAFDSYLRHADDVRVLACFDPNTPRLRGARYFEIGFRRKHHHNSNLKWELHNDLIPLECLPGNPVKTLDFCSDDPTHAPTQTEPVAKEGLSRFIRFALRHHKNARKHMLILFGHGSAVAGNTFLADNTPPSFLRLKELKEVLARHFDARQHPLSQADEEANDDVPDDKLTEKEKEEKRSRRPLDILACDNCMMNGIESAFEIRRRVKYIIGSQGLVLALGWPFRKVIEEVLRNRNAADPKVVAERILRVCARNLVDFTLMDRSSEQSFCDLTTFRNEKNLVTAVRRLSCALQDGLAHDKCGKPKYPPVCDAIRLARLEAQSYWSETFVDLYDFCALLLERSSAFLFQFLKMMDDLIIKNAADSAGTARGTKDTFGNPLALEIMQRFGEIGAACWDVLVEIKANQEEGQQDRPHFVLDSFYIGPDLQYSNGVSVYFPWTLPENPIIFEQEDDISGGGAYGLSWASVERARGRIEKRVRDEIERPSRARKEPTDFKLKTAFDEYSEYDFAKSDGGDWAAFLTAFFRATLRNVRRFDFRYVELERGAKFFMTDTIPEPFFNPLPINLQKSSSDADSETDCTCPTIKNYPHRFYLSPADCLRRCDLPRRDEKCYEDEQGQKQKQDKEACASYLGWNVRGIVAEVIDLKPKSSVAADGGPDDAAEA